MFTVTTPAPDRCLLSIDELRAAVGIADESRDDDLIVLGDRISAAIASACNVASDGVTPPTLRTETLTETIRVAPASRESRPHHLILSRRPIISVTTVVEDGVVLAATDYEIQAGAGLLLRLCNDKPAFWAARKTIVVYPAGWAVVPDDLKLAAAKLATVVWVENARDPNLRREIVEGVGTFEYWVPPTTDPAFPTEVLDLLAPYINHWLA